MTEEGPGAFRVQTVAVIGAGTAGRAFALRCARSGMNVVLEDVMPSKLRRAQDDYAELSSTSAAGHISFVNTVEDAVANADLAIDFVPDELESKLEIFCLLDRMAPPRTVLCTPTETLSTTDLASCTYRADRCVGVRFLGDGGAELTRSPSLNRYAESLTAEFFQRIGYAVQVGMDCIEPMLGGNATFSTSIRRSSHQ